MNIKIKYVVRLFLASPGDVELERKYVHEIVKELNPTVAGANNIVLEVVCWENDTYPNTGDDPQSVVNRQIATMSECEIFVGIMWNRIGTKTPRAESGTLEEFEAALKAKEINPESVIMFYFSNQPINLNNPEDLEQN